MKKISKDIKKIGIFCGYFPPHMGGVERYSDKLSAELVRMGYELVIVTSRQAGLPSKQSSKNRTIYRLPILKLFSGRYPIPRLGREYKNLKRMIQQEEIDLFIVNTRFYLTSLIGARLAKRCSKPVFLIEHGSAHLTVDNKLLDYCGSLYEHLLTSLIKKSVDKYFGVSKACCDWLRHFKIKASGVLYNAVDFDDIKKASHRFDNIKKEEIVVAYAGRLIHQKGIINLLRAFKNIEAKTNKKLRLVVAGDGELLEAIRTEYRASNIDIVGRLDFSDVLSLLKRADVFVLSSLHPEGLPTSVLEAGMMGCAVISTPAGGAKEIIGDSTVGLLVDGSIKSIEMALAELVDSPKIRLKLSRNLNKLVQDKFTWQKTAQELKDSI